MNISDTASSAAEEGEKEKIIDKENANAKKRGTLPSSDGSGSGTGDDGSSSAIIHPNEANLRLKKLLGLEDWNTLTGAPRTEFGDKVYAVLEGPRTNIRVLENNDGGFIAQVTGQIIRVSAEQLDEENMRVLFKGKITQRVPSQKAIEKYISLSQATEKENQLLDKLREGPFWLRKSRVYQPYCISGNNAIEPCSDKVTQARVICLG